MNSLLIIIPAFNEELMIGKVISSFPEKFADVSKTELLVINDGSTDKTGSEATRKNVKVLHHLLNRGLGAALGTGFFYALKKKYDFVITFDADGQHNWNEVKKIIQPLLYSEADVVIGSRFLQKNQMPLSRKIVNIISNWITFLLFSVWTSDSQSGLRGFTRFAIQQIKIKSQRMEVSSEIFKEVYRHKLHLKEVSISSIYTDYSLRKGQKISNAPNVFWKLLMQKFS